MTGRKVLSVVMALMMLVMLPAFSFADGASTSETFLDDGAFFATGEVDFILNERARIVGIKEIGENVKKLEFQFSTWAIPSGNLENGFVREKAMAKVMSEDGEFLLGTTKVEVAITIFKEHVSIVQEIVGQLTAENILRATIYQGEAFCERTRYSAHKFFVDGQAAPVGTITFKNGTSCLLYAGNWENGICKLHLGFKAGYQQYTRQSQGECRWDPQQGCWITSGCGACGWYEYHVYVYESYCAGGYYTYGGNSCGGKKGGSNCR